MPKLLKPKITYYIDKNNRNKAGLAPIKANISANYKNQTKIIGHVLPTDWNTKQQRVRPSRPGKSNDHELINKLLENLQKEFKEFSGKCELNKIPLTSEAIKRFLKGERTLTEKSFWLAYDEYLL